MDVGSVSGRRGWLIAQGGMEKLPMRGYWTLPARDLWAMGYRRCAE
jgi:hypothetical protein